MGKEITDQTAETFGSVVENMEKANRDVEKSAVGALF